MCYDISRGLLCDCENLREPSNSIRFKLGSTLLVTNCRGCARLQGQMWNVPSHRRDNCRHRDTRPRAGGEAPRAGGGGTQQLVMIHTCCEVSIRRAAIQCLRITHSPSHNHQAVRYKWFDLETLSYTECKKWLETLGAGGIPRDMRIWFQICNTDFQKYSSNIHIDIQTFRPAAGIKVQLATQQETFSWH